MCPIQPNQLRQLLQTQYPDGTELLALIRQLATNARSDTTIPRKQAWGTYAIRLRISNEVTGVAIEGLTETVTALAATQVQEVRLFHTQLAEGSAMIFATKDLSRVFGILIFKASSPDTPNI
jgi:hypothetical protein